MVEGPIGNFYDSGLFSASRNGTLTYWSPGNVQSRLTWFDAQGRVLSTIGELGPYEDFALSPDGTQAFLSKRSQALEGAVWLLDMSRGTSTGSSSIGTAYNEKAIWSPDGRKVIFGSARAGQMMNLSQKSISGSADAEVLVTSSDFKSPLSWSPDGRSVLYESVGGKTRGDLWVLPLGNHRAPVSFLQTAFDERDGEFSPDGRWIAYASNESGRDEVYVRPFSSDSLRDAAPGLREQMDHLERGRCPPQMEEGRDGAVPPGSRWQTDGSQYVDASRVPGGRPKASLSDTIR